MEISDGHTLKVLVAVKDFYYDHNFFYYGVGGYTTGFVWFNDAAQNVIWLFSNKDIVFLKYLLFHCVSYYETLWIIIYISIQSKYFTWFLTFVSS